jgi:hypothetical protein
VIRRWLISATGLALFMLVTIVALVLLFDKYNYTQEELEWCAAERPLLPMEICAREFGY